MKIISDCLILFFYNYIFCCFISKKKGIEDFPLLDYEDNNIDDIDLIDDLDTKFSKTISSFEKHIYKYNKEIRIKGISLLNQFYHGDLENNNLVYMKDFINKDEIKDLNEQWDALKGMYSEKIKEEFIKLIKI